LLSSPSDQPPPPVLKPNDVTDLMIEIGLGQNDMDRQTLLNLTDEDMKHQLKLNLGKRKNLRRELSTLGYHPGVPQNYADEVPKLTLEPVDATKPPKSPKSARKLNKKRESPREKEVPLEQHPEIDFTMMF